MSKEFICCKCKKHLEESYMFDGFSHSQAVSDDLKQKEYCAEHFELSYQEIVGKAAMKEKNGQQQMKLFDYAKN